jgi:hypothetical protein
MNQSVSFVDNETDEVLFSEWNITSIPRTSEMINYKGKWYKVRQVYYVYNKITKDEMYCSIEVNLERSNFE